MEKFVHGYGAVIVGRHIYAKRNDGREFVGMIHNVRAMENGTLLTIAVSDDEKQNGIGYRNVYLENLSDWETYTDAHELQDACL